jgi:DUF4097 and DUF4098 domain-containing protein YvlB
MMRRLSTIALVIALAPVAAFAQNFSEPVQVFSGEVAQGAWLRIRNLNGRIEVREAPGRTVTVSAVKRMDDDVERDVKFTTVRDGANVTVCAMWPRTVSCDSEGYDYDSDNWGRRNRRTGRVDFTVSLPKGVKLVAATGNGVVAVRDAGAEVNASSGNGEVSVLGANGRVRASSGNGDIEVDRARGDVHASSGNGTIRVTTSTGPVSASTGNGSIRVDMASISNPSDMEFSTGNGSITVRFPANLSANIEANVPWRNMQTDFPMQMESRFSGRHIEGKIGNGGPRIRFSTGNGSVSIEKSS